MPNKGKTGKKLKNLAFKFDIFAIQPNLVIKSIASKLCAFIVGLLLKFLGMIKFFTVNQNEFFKLSQQFISQFQFGIKINVFFEKHTKMLVAV